MPDRLIRLIIASIALLAVPWVAEGQITRGPLQPPGSPTVLPATAVDPAYGVGPAMGAYGGMGTERAPTIIDPNRKLQPGDQLSFKIEQDREPAIRLVVAHTGDVVVEPVEHAIHVAGMTPRQASDEIKRQLEKDYYYQATVRLSLEVASAQVGYVYFTGAVARVGPLPIQAERPIKLSDGISSIGGFGRYANDRKVQVIRSTPNGVQTFVVDVKAIQQKGQLDKDIELKDGDKVFVPETFIKN